MALPFNPTIVWSGTWTGKGRSRRISLDIHGIDEIAFHLHMSIGDVLDQLRSGRTLTMPYSGETYRSNVVTIKLPRLAETRARRRRRNRHASLLIT